MELLDIVLTFSRDPLVLVLIFVYSISVPWIIAYNLKEPEQFIITYLFITTFFFLLTYDYNDYDYDYDDYLFIYFFVPSGCCCERGRGGFPSGM